MNFKELAAARYSVRKFKNIPIEREKIQTILEAGLLAPTAKNQQPQKLFVVTAPDKLEKLRSVCRCTFGAPLIIVAGYDKGRSWRNDLIPGYESGETDCAIVCTHMLLQATELGLGSCWVGWFNDRAVAEALDIPDNIRVCAMLPIGIPADEAHPAHLHTDSRSLEDIVAWL